VEENMSRKMQLRFDKDLFKRSVEYNVRTMYRREMSEATRQQVFQASAYALKDQIIDNWMRTQKAFEEKNPKTLYYLSMEFLMGRAFGNDLINLQAFAPVQEALAELGFDINEVEDEEPDPALGNGGLGRLAACFLDSLATLNYPAYGCGIRYRYGMFKQEIRDGYQVEVPDNWLENGNPFELRRPEYTQEVHFGGYVTSYQPRTAEPCSGRRATAPSRPSPTTCRWSATATASSTRSGSGMRSRWRSFHLDSFDKGDYQKAVEEANLARTICEVLYPCDDHIHSVNGVAKPCTPRSWRTPSSRRSTRSTRRSSTTRPTASRSAAGWSSATPASKLVSSKIGEGWKTKAEELEGLLPLKDDDEFLSPARERPRGQGVQQARSLPSGCRSYQGDAVDPDSIFDVQSKRLHEYKRQQLNLLWIIREYLRISELDKEDELPKHKVTIFFGAKAAPAYTIAKDIIHAIICLSKVIAMRTRIASKYLQVVMIENYNVTRAERLIPRGDISEQISLASKEASGTSNMKFMLNGAVTLGTMDGANVEIAQEVGAENMFIFGLSSQEVIQYENHGGYNPMEIFNSDSNVREVLVQLVDGTYSKDNPERFRPLYNALLYGENGSPADRYFILKDFESYADAQRRIVDAYRDQRGLGEDGDAQHRQRRQVLQ
jgi:glucan phosphorylase